MRRISIALITAAIALSLTACGAGFNASTRQVTQVTDGVEGTIKTDGNNLKLLNILVVKTAEGAGVLVGTIVNGQANDDALLGVAINRVVATVTGTNALPQNSPIRFEGESANAKAVAPLLEAKTGAHVPVTMFFAHGGEITVLALVREQQGTYAGITA